MDNKIKFLKEKIKEIEILFNFLSLENSEGF
jgi:hypothetical protein